MSGDLLGYDVSPGEIVTMSDFGQSTADLGWWEDLTCPAWRFAQVVGLFPKRGDLIFLKLRSGRVGTWHRRFWAPAKSVTRLPAVHP